MQRKGTNRGAMTDSAGQFVLAYRKGAPVTLQASYVGFTTTEVQVKAGHEDVAIVMKMEPVFLGELIVTRRKPSKKTVFHQFNKYIADSLRKKPFTIYPNPAVAGATIKAESKAGKGDYYIQVLDLNGIVLQEEKINAPMTPSSPILIYQ